MIVILGYIIDLPPGDAYCQHLLFSLAQVHPKTQSLRSVSRQQS